jgi:hypothetical protein
MKISADFKCSSDNCLETYNSGFLIALNQDPKFRKIERAVVKVFKSLEASRMRSLFGWVDIIQLRWKAKNEYKNDKGRSSLYLHELKEN